MSDVAIRVDNLSKQFRIGQGRQAQYNTLRDQLADVLTAPVRRLSSLGRRSSATGNAPREDTIWALKDVSFEVKRGEVVGIIGRNGAGKSTLLKVLSRITEPTTGYAELRGRVGSLLEVGTGFHPELSGRENIYLNGTILGMKRSDIERKFDEIVAFAEVEKFIDTPVKHYSSGMYLRLAFAVAAHLDLEILVVDEVLAVGDTSFQKKCLGKMGEVAKEGRTSLFVSHNMAQVKRLCEVGIWLQDGRSVAQGEIDGVVAAYQSDTTDVKKSIDIVHGSESQEHFLSWRLLDSAKAHRLQTDGPIALEIQLQVARPVFSGHHGLVLHSAEGERIGGWGVNGLQLQPGVYNVIYHFPSLPVRPGVYSWYASLWDGARKVDISYLTPDLVVATKEHSILNQEWAGILNLPCEIRVNRTQGI